VLGIQIEYELERKTIYLKKILEAVTGRGKFLFNGFDGVIFSAHALNGAVELRKLCFPLLLSKYLMSIYIIVKIVLSVTMAREDIKESTQK
jgi:hypothetical protein